MAGDRDAEPRLIDERLLAALSHTTREHALSVFSERPASTKELAAELDQSVSAVWYHVNKLVELGCIEEVDSKKRRGATERFYRAKVDHLFDLEMWQRVPEEQRNVIAMRILGLISRDITEGIRAHTIDTVDNHLSRTPMTLDKQGWDEATQLLDKTLEGLLAIRSGTAKRLAENEDGDSFRTAVAIMQFELPTR